MRKATIAIAGVLAFVFLPYVIKAQVSLPPEVAKDGYADMIVVNGKIVSVDDRGYNPNPGHIYPAMAIKKSRIMALGTVEKIRSLANSNTRVIDLQGRTVIPGVIDGHIHIFGDREIAAAMGLQTPDKGINVSIKAGKDFETTTLKAENALKDALTKVQPGDWVSLSVGANADEKVSSSRVFAWGSRGDFMSRDRIDRLATQNPVVVATGPRSTVNTAGWDLMKSYFPAIDDFYTNLFPDAPDAPKKGLIGVDVQTAMQWEIWWGKQPISLLADMMRRSLDKAAAHGITTFGTRLTNTRIMDVYSFLNRERRLPIRFMAIMEAHRRPRDPIMIRQLYQMTGNLTGIGDDYMWIGGVGSEEWDSSFPQNCSGPDLPAPPEIKKREMCIGPGNMYYDVLKNAISSGWRLAQVHGVASHGVRLYIQMVESVMKETGMTVEDVRNLHLAVDHNEALGAPPDVIAGLKKYGIILSVNPQRLFRTQDYVKDYGPKAEGFMMPIKTWLDQGVEVVGEMERYTNVGYVWTIPMTRRVFDGKVVLPEEAVDRVTVLKMWTNWSADYVLKAKDTGSLEVGKLADFVVLDRDYLTIPIDDIPKIRPLATVVGGQFSFLDADFGRTQGMEPVGYQFPAGYEPWGKYVPMYGE